jgi:hypothetical protein
VVGGRSNEESNDLVARQNCDENNAVTRAAVCDQRSTSGCSAPQQLDVVVVHGAMGADGFAQKTHFWIKFVGKASLCTPRNAIKLQLVA